MSGENSAKDKEMASNLKSAGAARRSMKCPCCHAVIHSNTRIEPSEGNKKGFSAFDFGGALHNHLASCGR